MSGQTSRFGKAIQLRQFGGRRACRALARIASRGGDVHAKTCISVFLVLLAFFVGWGCLTATPALADNFTAHITGKVTDAATGEAITSGYVIVELYWDFGYYWDRGAWTYTDAAGNYDFGGVGEGTYKVRFGDVSGLGTYAPQYYNGKTTWGSADLVTVGADTTTINAALVAASHITGKVTDAATGEAITSGNIIVSAYIKDGSGWDYAEGSYSDAAGNYVIAGLAAGTYIVDFYDVSGSYYAEQYYNGKTTQSSADTVTVGIGTTTAGINVALVASSARSHITGKVTDAATGKAITSENIGVIAYIKNGSTWDPAPGTHTDEAGNYDIVGLVAGTYIVEFSVPDFSDTYLPQYYNGKTTQGSADTVTVGTGTTTAGINVALSSDLPAPTVTAVSPTSGPTTGGTSVTITGTNFNWESAVSFGGTDTTNYTVDSDTQITATAPAHSAGIADVVVTIPGGGPSATSPADRFTYVFPPTVTAVSPTSGPTAGGTSVVITGTNLSGASAVTFGGTDTTNYTVDSDTQITVTSPAHASGKVQVQVTTAGGSSADTSTDDYTYTDGGSAPAIASLGPTFGPTVGGTSVTIAGAGFTGATAVTFDGDPAAIFNVDSDIQITATSPAHAKGVVDVQVSGPDGASENTTADDYTYQVTYSSIRGSDRYDTAIRVSQALFPGTLPAGSGVVVAPGETFQEALCGGPLASAWGGPVLLTYKTALANNVRAELLRLAPSQVFCIGMAPAVATAVRAALPTATVVTINGSGTTANIPYDMSRRVANALEAKVGDMTGATAIITLGSNFPDAIGVGPMACTNLWPIILTNSGGTTLHASAAATLADLGITQTIKVGTYATLPAGVTGLANLSGSDRYVTNANVANWAQAHAGLTFTHTGIATGDKFPDALASGPYLAQDDGILLLSPLLGPVPPAIAAVLTANQAAVQHVTFIACIEPVIGQVKARLP